jgi:hypothetical protein
MSDPVTLPDLQYMARVKVFYGHVVEDIQTFLQGKPVRVINAARV